MSVQVRAHTVEGFVHTGLKIAWVVALTSTMAVAGAVSIPSRALAADVTPVDLGTAVTYGALSGASVANTVSVPPAPYTIVRGDLGVSSTGAIVGFKPVGPGVVTGTIHSNDAAAIQAIDDLTIAYDEAEGRATTAPLPLPPVLGGEEFTPGVYRSSGAVGAAASVIVTLSGPAEGVFIFQVKGALTIGANTQVVLTGGAQASNVFWQVDAAVDLGAGVTFAGTLMAHDAVAVGSGTVINGRAMALFGAITLDNNKIYSPALTVTIDGGPNRTVTDSDVTITGTSNAGTGTPVAVSFDGAPYTPSILVNGTWSVHVGLKLDGVYPVTASVTDGAGNVGNATQSLTIDTVDPIVIIDGGTTATTNDVTPTISGTSDTNPGSIVSIDIDGQIRSALVQSDSTWNFTANLPAGSHTIIAAVADVAGNPGTASQTLIVDTTPPLVTITGGASRQTNDATPTMTGTSDLVSGTQVTVTVADQTLVPLVQADGTWTTTATAVADGTHLVTASVRDPAGNTVSASQVLTVDTSPPPVDPSPPVDPPPPVVPVPSVVSGRVRLTAIEPMRLVDTRGGSGGASRVGADGVLRVKVAGTVAVPADVTAAGLNVTVVDPDDGGFVTVYPCTPTPPTTSTLNFAAGRAIANSTIATLSSDGYVCVYASTGADVIVDITAWLSPSAAMAMTSTAPRRAADTRSGSGGSGRLAAGGVLTVAVGDQQASAAALNVTAVGADDAGFLTVYPCGTTPITSTVNFEPAEARPNNTIVAVGPGGLVCVFSSAAVDVIVDVTAVFAAAGQLEYLPANPQRLLDTRASRVVEAGGQVAFVVPSPGAVASAVSVNVTATGHTDNGFATAFSCGTNVPDASTLNQRVGEANANGAIVPAGAESTACVFTSTTTNLIVDLNGWWVQVS